MSKLKFGYNIFHGVVVVVHEAAVRPAMRSSASDNKVCGGKYDDKVAVACEDILDEEQAVALVVRRKILPNCQHSRIRVVGAAEPDKALLSPLTKMQDAATTDEGKRILKLKMIK
jgi:hypothetical protein